MVGRGDRITAVLVSPKVAGLGEGLTIGFWGIKNAQIKIPELKNIKTIRLALIRKLLFKVFEKFNLIGANFQANVSR